MQLLPEERERITLSLASLTALKQVSVTGQFATRDLNEQHVEALVLSNEQEWAPILVTCTAEHGYLYYDGQHRIEAARRKGRSTIVADCHAFASENALIEATFQANLRHGLQATQEYRSDYAYWLYVTFGKQMTQEQIAARAGITQSVVSKAIKRREKWLKEAKEGKEGVEAQQEARGQLGKKLLKFARTIYTEAEAREYDDLVQEMRSLMKKPEDRDALYYTGQLLVDATKFLTAKSRETLRDDSLA
jgi:transcriptional regulator with XRE-family HTH domain/uncharacterized ParB-like nuclease family protein